MRQQKKSVLDNIDEIERIDKSNMLQFSIEAPEHYDKAFKISEQISVNYTPENIIIAGMGGSGIGGELLKDYTRNQLLLPLEVNKDYTLPAYTNERSLVIIVSYSGDTEESLSAFLDAVKRKCMIYCITSGGRLLELVKRLKMPFLEIPAGMPPRAASPYLFVPQLILLEKLALISDASEDLKEAIQVLRKISQENAPEKSMLSSTAKSLASEINGTVPTVYGFGIYRGVAQRWKQQFNENTKIPAKWEVFPELNHNEIVGWEKADALAKAFSIIFLRDNNEPAEIRKRIETTKTLLESNTTSSKQFELWSQGKSILAKILSVILIGDFTSVYLSLLRNVDPTPVSTIVTLKKELDKSGTKERIVQELEKIAEQ
ncbi:MAG TPA: bifunctional phosphoglucose/phosphomannose isomerase [Candidatus Sulfotelmatobacter sp.]|nr:bifunctional phosphoglucose/phosphomannose isomerase [Candidatus Sulfotelmatobacter sp.]